jgi:hypothetical protein
MSEQSLPPLPAPFACMPFKEADHYTAAQMRAYGRLCRDDGYKAGWQAAAKACAEACTAQYAPNAQSENAQEPVAWQYRYHDSLQPWCDCTRGAYERMCKNEFFETRALYAAPPEPENAQEPVDAERVIAALSARQPAELPDERGGV